MLLILRTGFALAVPICMGYIVDSLIVKNNKEDISALERFTLAFLIGTGILTIEMLIFSMFKIQSSIINILIPWLILTVLFAIFIVKQKICVFDLRGWTNLIKELFSGRKNEQRKIVFFFEKALIIAIFLRLLYVFFETLIKPVVGFDAFAFWSIKAKILFVEKGLIYIPDILRYTVQWLHGAYPAHIPYLESWIATCLGTWNDIPIKIIFPIFFLCLIILLYSSLRKEKNRIQSLFFAFLFSSLPLVTYHASIEYADLPIAAYYTASVLFLYRFIKERKMNFLIISAFTLGMTGWTKNEGIALFLINLTILLFFLLFCPKITLNNKIKDFFVYFGFAFLFMIPWQIFKKMMQIPAEGDQMPQISKLLEYTERIPTIINKFYEKMFFFGNWYILWFVLILAVVLYYRKILSSEKVYLLAIIILNILLFAFIYYSTPSYSFLLDGTTLNRNFLIFVPIAMFFIGCLFE